jgi:hypothetical protein
MTERDNRTKREQLQEKTIQRDCVLVEKRTGAGVMDKDGGDATV